MASNAVLPPSDPSPRASDRDRDRAVDVLSAACADGRLGLEDFSQRLERALSAATLSELASLTTDLSPAALPATSRAGFRGSSWFLSVMASTVRRGRWHLSPSAHAVAVMGECVLDLRNVEVEAAQTHILAIALMGSIKIIVPEGIDCDISGLAVMGSKRMRGGAVRPLPGSPTIRVTCLALMGDVNVKVKSSGSDSDDRERWAHLPDLPARRVRPPASPEDPERTHHRVGTPSDVFALDEHLARLAGYDLLAVQTSNHRDPPLFVLQ
ncbi:MAG: DUF1707 SHOCT-like domain-containing protein [Candidatus Dormibacteria bacterium]